MEAIDFVKSIHKPFINTDLIDPSIVDEYGKNYYYYLAKYVEYDDIESM